MSTRVDYLLSQWYPQRDTLEWVLATITETKLSSYRKAGAMMLINSRGHMLGMLSGGCLEGDLLRQARKVLMSNKAHLVTYDLREDGDTPWQVGIGCGGSVTVLLQTVNAKNTYLGLDRVRSQLLLRQPVVYEQRVDKLGIGSSEWHLKPFNQRTRPAGSSVYTSTLSQHGSGKDHKEILSTPIFPAPMLMIFGGGPDAVPLARLAHDIGWTVCVVDRRQGYASEDDFTNAEIIREDPANLKNAPSADAIVIMNHNLNLDASALRFSRQARARYVGILGPAHRREKVERLADTHGQDFEGVYCGPIGIDIGARLPETIALSILAQCHAIVEADVQTSTVLNAGAYESQHKTISHGTPS